MITTFTYDRCNPLTTTNAGGNVTTYTHDMAGNLLSEVSASKGKFIDLMFGVDNPKLTE